MGTVCASISSLPQASPDGHYNEGYYNNTCILPEGGMYLRAGGCSSQALAGNFSITMGGNTVYIKGKQPTVDCGDVKTWSEWQAKAAHVDAATTVNDAISADDIIKVAAALLSVPQV